MFGKCSILEQASHLCPQHLCPCQALAVEAGSIDRAAQRAHQDARALEEQGLRALSEATTAEKSSVKTAADIQGERMGGQQGRRTVGRIVCSRGTQGV